MICTHTHTHYKCTHFAVKKLTLAVCVAITNSASAAIFQPGVNETEYNQDLEISYTKNNVSPTGIGFTGGTSSTPVEFEFNGNVNITLKQDSMTSDPSWSAYGVWINNSREGSVNLEFHKDLLINVQNTTNMGVGLVCGTLYTGVGMDGLNNGTTMTMHGASTVNVHGNSVIGAAAGSMFNNNSNGGGRLVFGGLHDSKQHAINVTSDWSSNTNTSKDSDWAIGLLAFDDGTIDIQGDMNINLDVKNMKVNNKSLTGTWEDHAAGIYVAKGSHFTTGEDVTLNITVSGDGSGLERKTLVPIHGIIVGQDEAAAKYSGEHSKVTLNGSTNINLSVNSPKNNGRYSGISVVGGSKLEANEPVLIQSQLKEKIDFSEDQKIDIYGVSAGTYLPDTQIASSSHCGSANFNNGLIVKTPVGYNPALNHFIALHSNNTRRYSGEFGGIYIDNRRSQNVVQIEGLTKTEWSGFINLILSGKDSFISGAMESIRYNGSRDGFIYLTLENGATWNVLENLDRDKDYWYNKRESQVYNIDLASGGSINLSRPDHYNKFFEQSPYQTVKVWDYLKGNDGRMIFDMNLVEEKENEDEEDRLTDQIIVTNKAEGTHTAQIKFIGDMGKLDPQKRYSYNWLVSQGDDSNMTLTNSTGGSDFSGRGWVSVWNLVFVPEGEEDLLTTEEGRKQLTNTGVGKGNWHLVKVDKWVDDPPVNPPVDPDKPIIPPEVQDNITVANSASMALAYDADLEDLRTRLGEVRYGAQDGLWAKAFAKQNRLSGSGLPGFKQEIYGLNLGLDHLVKADEESAWLFGGAFRYSDADQKGLGVGYTTGTLQEYSGKLYATWMHDKGSYADFVLQAGRYEQKLDGFDNTGMDKSKADYGTWGFGASIEVGHMFSFGENVDDRQWFNHWFLEPQLQLSYFRAKGADYTTSTGLKVDQGDADYLTGRAGVVLGKKFNYGSINDLDKRYFQIALIGGAKHEFIGGDQDITYTGVDGDSLKVSARDIDGTRFYYGVNADWQLARDWRLYAKFEREKGNDFCEDYDVSVGFKYAF